MPNQERSNHILSSDANADDFVTKQLKNPATPVTLFSLSWCSFCRAAKQLLQQLGISYQVFELDTGEFDPGQASKIRQQLQSLTGSATLPQLFIGGETVGGYTDLHAAWQQGRLAAMLKKHGIETDNSDQTG